ncbi:hypothetical protein [Yoonia maricola]|nr:hypothetical protein [Yoonia maricola]
MSTASAVAIAAVHDLSHETAPVQTVSVAPVTTETGFIIPSYVATMAPVAVETASVADLTTPAPIEPAINGFEAMYVVHDTTLAPMVAAPIDEQPAAVAVSFSTRTVNESRAPGIFTKPEYVIGVYR